MGQVKRLLFVSESVTLSQVVRLLSLAGRVDRARFEVHFADSARDDALFAGARFRRWRITGAEPEAALNAAAQGRLPSARLLARQVEEDLALLERVRPDVIIGDFRLSLTVSAPLARIPLFSLVNAYWSPRRLHRALPLPEHPLVRWFGPTAVTKHFERFAPKAMALASSGVNRLRRSYGLPGIGDLLEVLTFGDRVLYPDAPELTPLAAADARERFIGPILWSPAVPVPQWWAEIDGRRPLVYVTLGSSGDLGVLPIVLEALAALPVEVAVSTAGRVDPRSLGSNVRAAAMLPGDIAAQRAALVITNGGASTSYQALYEGTPVLGLPSNLDQYLAMTAIERFGAGLLVRSGTADREGVRRAVDRILREPQYAERAEQAKAALRALDPHVVFERVLAELSKEGS